MKKNRLFFVMLLCICMIGLAGCKKEVEPPKEVDFSEVNAVCQLATLKCYYHNVAKSETEASGLLGIFGIGYKKIWTEYSGIVQVGIDVSKVSVSKPDANGVVKVTIPDAEILSIDIDEESMGEPLTDSGFLTTITKEDETAALANAQKNMEETAQANVLLLGQAKDRAKNLLEGYIKNVGELVGEEYTIEWIAYKDQKE